jgi:phage-related protein
MAGIRLEPVSASKGSRRQGEIVTDGDRDTYRTVYTVEFAEAGYVVDAFQKKSKRGIATAQEDISRARI